MRPMQDGGSHMVELSFVIYLRFSSPETVYQTTRAQ